ncbi:MAG: NUDIX domain-containing protein [Candidatus Bathyarchaeota archaeon]|nr:NUDIX domain-containing protein [Candidatus Bathyarchaeota archaeon]
MLKEGKLLVEKRRSDRVTDPGVVAVPGGYVKAGESLEATCRRELYEKLDLQCNSYHEVGFMLWSTPMEHQRVHYFHCVDWWGEPKPREAEAIFFIEANSLQMIDITEEREILESFFSQQMAC